MTRPLALAALLAAGAAAPAGAVFTRAEMAALDTEPLFDSEYFCASARGPRSCAPRRSSSTSTCTTPPATSGTAATSAR